MLASLINQEPTDLLPADLFEKVQKFSEILNENPDFTEERKDYEAWCIQCFEKSVAFFQKFSYSKRSFENNRFISCNRYEQSEFFYDVLEKNQDDHFAALRQQWETKISDLLISYGNELFVEWSNTLSSSYKIPENLEKSPFILWLNYLWPKRIKQNLQQAFQPQIICSWMDRFTNKISPFWISLENCQEKAIEEISSLSNAPALHFFKEELQNTMENKLFSTLVSHGEKLISAFSAERFPMHIQNVYSLKKLSEFPHFYSISNLPFDETIEAMKNKLVEESAPLIVQIIKDRRNAKKNRKDF
jgi:hypothetical protein